MVLAKDLGTLLIKTHLLKMLVQILTSQCGTLPRFC
jgi:hypothetical protein